jgi:hypothetical protein
MKPKDNDKQNKRKLMILPQIMYGKDRYYLYSNKYTENKELNYPKLSNFTLEFMILPNKTNSKSPKEYNNIFSINNKDTKKYDLLSVRYSLFNNELMICYNNQSNNVYTCKKINQKLNQSVWNSVILKISLKQIEIQINNQHKEVIPLNNSIMIGDIYEFEFGKLSGRPNQNKRSNTSIRQTEN